MQQFQWFLWVLSVSLLWACKDLPKERYVQFPFHPETETSGDSVRLILTNTVACPVRVEYFNQQPGGNCDTNLRNQIVMEPYQERRVSFAKVLCDEESVEKFGYEVILGDPDAVNIDTSYRYKLPFPAGRSYKILQAHNGKFSHRSAYSRYAIDFDLSVGDTICAPRDGVVVGVIEGYDIGGKSDMYRPFANFITLYHEDGTLTQYVHLKKDGALVALGDSVKALDPIGISGNTGFTNHPHLHFNSLRPVENGVESYPVNFEGIAGKDIRRGMRLGAPAKDQGSKMVDSK